MTHRSPGDTVLDRLVVVDGDDDDGMEDFQVSIIHETGYFEN